MVAQSGPAKAGPHVLAAGATAVVADLVLDAAVRPRDDHADGATVVETERETVTYELGRDRLRAEVDPPFEALQPGNRHPVRRDGLMPVEPVADAMLQLTATAQLADTGAFLDSRVRRNRTRGSVVTLVCFVVHVLSKTSRTRIISSCFENGFGRKAPVWVTDARSNRSCSA